MTSIAHIGSTPAIRGSVPLPDGMILFPLNNSLYDTTLTVPLNGTPVVTFRNDEKKFFGSVAVEDGTTNLFPHEKTFETGLGNWTTQNGGQIERSNYVSLFGNYSMKVTANPNYSYSGAITPADIPVQPNTIYTMSYYIYIPHDVTLGGDWELHRQVISDEGKGDNHRYITIRADAIWNDNTPKGKWIRKYYTLQTYNETNMKMKFFVVSKGSSRTGGYVYVDGIQLEQKDHATSFTEGIRPAGRLRYDISHLGMRDAGCIAFWAYNSDVMVYNLASGGVVNNQYLIKLGSLKNNDWNADHIAIQIPNTQNRYFRFRTQKGIDNTQQDILDTTIIPSDLGLGTWNHFVIQWDKNGLPSGNKKEIYINGVLRAYNTTDRLPENILTYLLLGDWSDADDTLKPCTMFEQLAIHPSKGFSPTIIRNWYEAQAPFYDHRNAFVYY